MKKDKLLTPRKTIDNFEFHILPQSVEFLKPTHLSFFIYVEKGAQVIGKIDQHIRPTVNSFIFDPIHIKRFRVANDKNLTYQWSLYLLTSKDEEQFLESTSFNIKDQFDQYNKDFNKIQTDLYRIFAQKDKKIEIQQIWKDLRHDLKSQLEHSTTFRKIGIKLSFKIKILCEYDFMYLKWDKQRQKRKFDKKTSITRRESNESKSSMLKTSSENSLNGKQKNSENNQNPKAVKQNKSESTEKVTETKKSQQKQQIEQVMESQIRITSPEGVDLTMEIPEKFLNHRRAGEDEFYYGKKSSMLSDIIEESYEGSSNANLIKSNQGERLKSVEIIKEEEEIMMYSPMIRTQTFESQKHESYFNDIKRTATLAHKHSQEYEEQIAKSPSKKNALFARRSIQDHDPFFQSDTKQRLNNSGAKSFAQMEEQQKQVEVNYSEAKTLIIKNAIKVFIIIILLVLAINFVTSFQRKEPKGLSNPRSQKEKNYSSKRQQKDKAQKPKPLKNKN